MNKFQYLVGISTGLAIAFGFSVLYNKIPDAQAAAVPARPVVTYSVPVVSGKEAQVTEWRDDDGNKCVMTTVQHGYGVSVATSCYHL